MLKQSRIAAVLPSYRAKRHILQVLSEIGPEVDIIFVVDDACPEGTGKLVQDCCVDPRVKTIFHSENQGVGGAVITGYRAAMEFGADVIVKIDADGQMDPALVPTLARPLVTGSADYAKGDRFDSLEHLVGMPRLRLVGNAFLSIMSKFSSGYWSITDPTNGFTAIHRTALLALNLEKVKRTYFFESDMLYRLYIANCVVVDIPMRASYGDEVSNLKISKVLFEFPFRYAANFLKRIFYRYYLREWNVGSFELPFGFALLGVGIWIGLTSYSQALTTGLSVTAGQVTGTSLALILGSQMLLSFLTLDVQNEPRSPRQTRV